MRGTELEHPTNAHPNVRQVEPELPPSDCLELVELSRQPMTLRMHRCVYGLSN